MEKGVDVTLIIREPMLPKMSWGKFNGDFHFGVLADGVRTPG